MIKKLAFAALAATSLCAFGQDRNHDWDMQNDTYHVGNADFGDANVYRMWKVTEYDLRGCNANDAYVINTAIDQRPADESWVIVKSLANNFRDASKVRDEVAMARYGNAPDQFTWLTYPPLTWSDTPGQNSWTNANFDNTPMAMNSDNGQWSINVTDDSSRAMRMAIRDKAYNDIDYDRALWILGAHLNESERGTLHEMFRPTTNDPNSYSNQGLLDSMIRVIESNAKMVEIGRYAWYNHFDKDYYNKPHQDW